MLICCGVVVLHGVVSLYCYAVIVAYWHCDMLYVGKLLCGDDFVEASWYHDMLYGGILKLRDVVMVTCLPGNMLYKGRLLNCDDVDTVMAGTIAFHLVSSKRQAQAANSFKCLGPLHPDREFPRPFLPPGHQVALIVLPMPLRGVKVAAR